MRAGEFPDGAKVLRAKIDMSSPNVNMRDPVLYRIMHRLNPPADRRRVVHIYPLYDFAHGQSDAIEGITHSLCTLEFEDHRPLYDWLIENLPVHLRTRTNTSSPALQLHVHRALRSALPRAACERGPRARLGRSAHAHPSSALRLPGAASHPRACATSSDMVSLGRQGHERHRNRDARARRVRDVLNRRALRRFAVPAPAQSS